MHRRLRGRTPLVISVALAVATAAATLTPAFAGGGSQERRPARYWMGEAVESINPTPAMIAKKDFYLGGYGLADGKVANQVQTPLPGRYATGVLGDEKDGYGVAVRAVVFGDGRHAIALAQIETQGYYSAYKSGPFGIVDIRRDAAAQIAALTGQSGARDRVPRMAMGAGAILVDSNHTHSGPDTAGVWGGVPTAYLKLVHDRAVTAIVDAWQRLVPVELYYGTAQAGVAGEGTRYPAADPLMTNQFSTDPANQEVDQEIRVIQGRTPGSNTVVGTYLNYSAHATVLGSDNTLTSSDYTGVLSAQLTSLGGLGFSQVGTLGRSQPNRGGCPTPGLQGAAEARCELDSYATRVFHRAEEAIASAKPLLGTPIVAMHSYLMQDLATNLPIIALSYGGVAVGAPIYRAVNPPWFTANVLGAPSFSGRVGDLLFSGGPGEMYPQIVGQVARTVPALGHFNIGTAGDFLGYIIAPFEAYPEPIRRSILSGDSLLGGDTCSGVASPIGCPNPVGNDNYFFNVSHTFGERLTCSLLRGAGQVMTDDKSTYWRGDTRCPAFANDYAMAPEMDTAFPAQPDLSNVPGFDH